jgi:DNA recombination protein RmuC
LGLLVGFGISWWSGRTRTSDQISLLKEEHNRQVGDKDRIIESINDNLRHLQEQVQQLSTSLATAENENRNLERSLAEQDDRKKIMTNEFKAIAGQILDEKGGKLKEQQEQSLKMMLDPFKDRILEFQKTVQDIHHTDTKERSSLKTELSKLVEQNLKLSAEANNLTKALKGDVKMQGNWGEMILQNILELSGLRQDQEYFIQQSHTMDDGKRLQPDVEIKLPDNKYVIVDSKVSLVAYEQFVNTESNEERKSHLNLHVNSVRNHFKGLSSKAYTSLHGSYSPDFILLFIPIEGAFATALQGDSRLFQEAFDKGVIMVSPSTLLATLKTIASIWKQERLSRSHLEIADRAGFLYDKFVGLSETLITVGKQMDTAKGSYQTAMKQLCEGSGNLVRQVERLKELGAKAKKEIPAALRDRAADYPEEPESQELF